MSSPARRGLLCYALVTLALWPFPLLRILHVESAAIIALAGFFIAGLGEFNDLRRSGALNRALTRQLSLLAVPWALLTVTLLWAPNCGYATGLVYFLLFTAPSVVLGTSIAFLIRQADIRTGRSLFILSGLAIGIGGVVYDLGLHPQFYTLNHIFGGVMAPIYDEEFDFRWALVPYRALTLAIAGLCIVAARLWRIRRGRIGRTPQVRGRLRGVAILLSLFIAGIYAAAAPLGINAPEWYIQRQLGSVLEESGITLHFDSSATSFKDARRIGRELAYHRHLLDGLFGEGEPESIFVYLYPDPFTRERLTGARFTNVAPVWLRRPQIHVLATESRRVLTHEMVHAVSRRFGLPWINASPAVGLVEGLAVALEAPSGGPSPHDQVLASISRQSEPDRQARAEAVAERLSPLGFWGGRGAVSYTSTGSFTAFLLEAYGPEPLRRVYRDGRFNAAFGKTTDELAGEWLEFLRGRPITSAAAGPTSRLRFSIPSLFERRCPHYTPLPRRHYLSALRAMAARDTTVAIAEASRAFELDSTLTSAADLASRLLWEQGEYELVLELLDGVSIERSGPVVARRAADATVLAGDLENARRRYQELLPLIPRSARMFRSQIVVREHLLARPDMLRLMLAGGRATEPGLVDAADSIAVSLAALRADEYARVLALKPDAATAAASSSLNEAAVSLRLMQMQIAEVAAEASGRPRLAQQYASAIERIAIEAGDLDVARAYRYRRSFYLWLADRRSETCESATELASSCVPSP